MESRLHKDKESGDDFDQKLDDFPRLDVSTSMHGTDLLEQLGGGVGLQGMRRSQRSVQELGIPLLEAMSSSFSGGIHQ